MAESNETQRRLTTVDLGLGSLSELKGAEPWKFYEALRGAGVPVWDPGLGAWLVSRYETQRKLCPLGEDEYRFPFVVEPGGTVPLGLDAQDWLDFISHGSKFNLLVTTGELHQNHRRWWINAFSPKVLESWAQRWALPIANEQIDRFIEHGHADLCSEFVERVSPRVMCAALGLPFDEEWVATLERHNFHHVSCNAAARSVRHASELPPGMLDLGREATQELRQMIRPYVEARRSGTGDDFISLIWRDADQLFGTDSDQAAAVTAWAIVAFMGGSETTAASAGTAFHLLLSQPGLLEEVGAGGEETLEQFVEEGLRLGGPADFRVRIAAHDTQIDGVQIGKGQPVISLMFSANRDPQRYVTPDRADLQRGARGLPRDHFAFSKGRRACPGQALARLQLRAIFATVLARLKDLRLDPEAAPARWVTRYVTRRLTPVNVRFAPSSASVGPGREDS